MNLRDHVKSISTAKADSNEIHHIGSGPYAVSDSQYSNVFSETIPFPRRLHGYNYDDWKEAREVKILETYDHTLRQKEKDPGSFTLPYSIHNVCFDKAFVDLGASVSVMPFSTYTNLGLGDLAHTSLLSVFYYLLALLLLAKGLLADKSDHEGKKLAGTLIDIPIFVGNFSIISGFSIIDDMDITSGVMLGMPFCKKFVSCQKIMEKFARRDECERLK
ncbi:retrotransposon protein, putative, ty3-gypsy subclass [Tanacetum coccineum]